MNEDFSLKEVFSHAINICTRVVTLVFAFSTVFVAILNEEAVNYSIKDIWCIITIGIISGLAFFIFYIPKKISKKLMIFLQIFYFLIINSTVIFIGFIQNWFNTNEKSSVILLETMFIVIYIAVSALFYFFDYRQANKLNQLLKKRKSKIS